MEGSADTLFASHIDVDIAGSASPIGDHKVICAQRALGACHLQVLCECLQPQSCACSSHQAVSATTDWE